MKTYQEALTENFDEWYEENKPEFEDIIPANLDHPLAGMNKTKAMYKHIYEAGWNQAIDLIAKRG